MISAAWQSLRFGRGGLLHWRMRAQRLGHRYWRTFHRGWREGIITAAFEDAVSDNAKSSDPFTLSFWLASRVHIDAWFPSFFNSFQKMPITNAAPTAAASMMISPVLLVSNSFLCATKRKGFRPALRAKAFAFFAHKNWIQPQRTQRVQKKYAMRITFFVFFVLVVVEFRKTMRFEFILHYV
jgi:hypothetical protein